MTYLQFCRPTHQFDDVHLNSQPDGSPLCFRSPIKGISVIAFPVIESFTSTHSSILQQPRILCVRYMRKLVARKSVNKRRIATLHSECSIWNKNNFEPIPTICQISHTHAKRCGPNRAEVGHLDTHLNSGTQIFYIQI